MERLAAFISPSASLAKAQALAGLAELLGYELVLDTHSDNRDGLVTLAGYAQSTTRVRLGTGVYPMLQLSPLALGQLAASVDELIGGRLVLGLGTSHRRVIEGWHGYPFPDSPTTAMREMVTGLRSLFTTGRAGAADDVSPGGFAFRGFAPRADLEIHVAALGPGMLQVAGEVADGVMTWLCSPDYIRDVVVPNVAEGARRAGRDPADIEITAAVSCAVSDGDPEPAYDAFRRMLTVYLGLPFYRSMLTDSGFGADIDRFDVATERGDRDAARAGMSREMLDQLGGIGEPEQVRAAIARYREAGASLPAIGPLTATGTASIDRVLRVAAGHDT